jgi:hypothetical protein
MSLNTLHWITLLNLAVILNKIPVTPAKAGVHNNLKLLDSRFRGNDKYGARRTFYETINIQLR